MRSLFLIFVLLAVAYGACSRPGEPEDHAVPAMLVMPAVPYMADGTAAMPQFQAKFSDYDDAYAQTQIRGWTVIVNRQLLEPYDPAVTNMALTLLERKFADIERAVNEIPLRTLQRVPIWIENGSNGQRGLAYHWSAEWLREHGYNPEKAKAVEIHSLFDFIEWEPTQPWFVLHELAHAYHDRALGENNEDITEAYENARRLGLYANVMNREGNNVPAYAQVNRMEYFAELSEAYFGLNDFYPFNRQDLRQHDPVGYALMEKVW